MVVVIAVLPSVTLFFTVAGGFAGNIDKNYFFSARNSGIQDDIIFETPSPNNNAVWVNYDDVKVKIDTSLEGTAISASPTFAERLFGERIFYSARSVTVLVQNGKEKKLWEEYIQSKLQEAKENTQPKTILPPG